MKNIDHRSSGGRAAVVSFAAAVSQVLAVSWWSMVKTRFVGSRAALSKTYPAFRDKIFQMRFVRG
jgi:hypothetical protein